MKIFVLALALPIIFAISFFTQQESYSCQQLPSHEALQEALRKAVQDDTSGQNLHLWASVVNRDGVVCVVAFSGEDRNSQLPGSRIISAQKAYTANAFSLDASSASNGSGASHGLAVSTANLYSTVLPGGTDYGLELSNPVYVDKAYAGDPHAFGTERDPMVGTIVGGVSVFGGGLALYNQKRELVGGIGLSGDTSCTDHFIAWRMRHDLNLDYLAETIGASGDPVRPDNLVFDMASDGRTSSSGAGHPSCANKAEPTSLAPVR